MSKGTKLTPKEKGFVLDKIAGVSTPDAIINNYDVDPSNRNLARVMGAENLMKPNVQKAIQEMLPDDLLADRHLAMLNKKEYTRTITEKGVEITEQPHGDVNKALDMAYKIKGTFAPEKHLGITVSLTELLKQAKEEHD